MMRLPFILAAALLAASLGWQAARAGHYKGGKFGPAVYVPDLPDPPADDKNKNKKLTLDDMWKRYGEWAEYLRKRIQDGKAVGPQEFDKFFDENYFKGDYDSIKELYEVRRRLSKAFSEYEGGAGLQRSLNEWTQRRLNKNDFKITVSEMANRVTVNIRIPDLNSKSINLNISDTTIMLSFQRKGAVKGEVTASDPYVKIYPVPDTAQPGTQKINVVGDNVRITFERK